jgi:hypothetical protein
MARDTSKRTGNTNRATVNGKHFKIAVPDYRLTSEAPPIFDSYIRLGASPGDVATEPGWELASIFPNWGVPPKSLAEDEHGGANKESLHLDGGWRDHTDGNRISTTMGNKLEVIGGHYRLVVLGGQHEHGSYPVDGATRRATLEKAHGLNIRGVDGPNGVVIHTEWAGEEKQDTKYVKHQKSWTYAETIESVTGWGPGAPEPDYQYSEPKDNPKVTNHSWLDSVVDETHIAKGTASVTNIGAGTIENVVIGGATASMTTIGGAQTSQTNVGGVAATMTMIAGAKQDMLNVGVGVTSQTNVVGGVADMTNIGIGSMSQTVVGGLQQSLTTVGAQKDDVTVVGGLWNQLAAASGITSIALTGIKMNLDVVGAQVDIAAAGIRIGVDATAVVLSASLGIKLGVHLGIDESIKLPEDKMTNLKQSVTCGAYTMTCATFTATSAGTYDVVATGSLSMKGANCKLGC